MPDSSSARFVRLGIFVIWAAFVAGCRGGEIYFEGRSGNSWANDLKAEDSLVRRKAVIALGRMHSINPGSQEIIHFLVRALSDSNDAVRLQAASALTVKGTLSNEALTGVLDALADSLHAPTRAGAAAALGNAPRSVAPRVAEALVPALKDESAEVRANAVVSLGRLAVHSPRYARYLRQVTSDPSAHVRASALRSLTALQIDAPDTLTIATYLGATRDTSAMVRVASLWGIGTINLRGLPAVQPCGPEIVKRLNDLLTDTSPDVRRATLITIGKIGVANLGRDQRMMARVRSLRIDPDPRVRREAAIVMAGAVADSVLR